MTQRATNDGGSLARWQRTSTGGRTRLWATFCGMPIRNIPTPLEMEFFIDVSMGFSIGLVVDREWDAWRLKEADGRNIGWVEMVEVGLLAIVHCGITCAPGATTGAWSGP